ncbi:MAG: lantibiotic dehydratase family protein [Lentimicrobiaceae bacterium]|nr:lantibiotic dehydratase family protein [Lentimicrobiaceae bacterium]
MPQYLPFQNFVFRTPVFPVNAFFLEMEKLEQDEGWWKWFLENPLLQEAIFLASPVLYEEIGKFLSGYLTKEKDIEKFKHAVLRYFSRMTSRCTPFGLFAGVSVGEFEGNEARKGAKAQIVLPAISNYRRYTRLDMHYLCALAQDMGKDEAVRRNVKYYPNSSLYVLGEQLRFVEYFYKKSRRIHQISSVNFSEYLEKIIHFAQKGATLDALVSLVLEMLPEENISKEEAESYIAELIDNQILVSGLEPEVTGKDFLIQVLNVLQEIPRYARNDDGTRCVVRAENAAAHESPRECSEQACAAAFSAPSIAKHPVIPSVARNPEQAYAHEAQHSEESRINEQSPLFLLNALLKKMDTQQPGKTLNLYKEAEEIIKTTETAYEKNYLFQVDMFKPVENATLSSKIADEILEAIELMNRMTAVEAGRATSLRKIAENFYERYEEREMPLLMVLDVESGIGYPANTGDISPLLEGYIFPNKEPASNSIDLSRITSTLHKKLITSYKSAAHIVEFTEQDFDFLKPNWDDLPQTISCMCEIFSCDNRDGARPVSTNIYLHSAGGSSAANMLGRFCHVNKALEEYVKEITHFESSQNPDKIYAEIVHLPESRLGNILLRPVLRDYEIPYLAKSSVSLDYQISLSDLFVSVRKGKIVLRSKRLNKEVVPRLSTAHNYSVNAMPVYHFLCDLQTQGLRGGVGFNWGALSNEFDFLPRAVYKNTILALATWKVKTEDFKKLIEKQNNTEIKNNIQAWRKERNIPQLALLTEGDNELLVDFENILSVKMLFSAIKKRPSFELKEFLFDMQNAVVKDEQGNPFTNEFIITFHKNKIEK